MGVLKVIKNRFSVRKFKDQPIEPEKLERILEAEKQHRRQRIFSHSAFLSARARRHWPLSILQPSADTAHRPFWWYATIRMKYGTIRLIRPSIREKSMLPSLQMKWFWRRGMRASHPAGSHILIRRKSTAD